MHNYKKQAIEKLSKLRDHTDIMIFNDGVGFYQEAYILIKALRAKRAAVVMHCPSSDERSIFESNSIARRIVENDILSPLLPAQIENIEKHKRKKDYKQMHIQFTGENESEVQEFLQSFFSNNWKCRKIQDRTVIYQPRSLRLTLKEGEYVVVENDFLQIRSSAYDYIIGSPAGFTSEYQLIAINTDIIYQNGEEIIFEHDHILRKKSTPSQIEIIIKALSLKSKVKIDLIKSEREDEIQKITILDKI